AMSRSLVVLFAVLIIACGGKKDPPKPEAEPKAEAEPKTPPPPSREEVERIKAEEIAAQSVKDAKAAQDEVTKLLADAEALSQRMTAAVDAVANAQNQADRDSATAALKTLRAEQADLEQRIAQAKAKSAKAER